jgi:hypothetical protein
MNMIQQCLTAQSSKDGYIFKCGFDFYRIGIEQTQCSIKQFPRNSAAESKKVYCVFAYMDKACNRISTEMVPCAPRITGVKKWLIATVMEMHEAD